MGVLGPAILICGALLIVGYHLRAPTVVGLMASRAFGATAVASIGFLHGASPLIYTVFAFLVVVSAATRKHVLRDLGVVFRNNLAAWAVCALMVYAVIGSILLPRLFAGQTSVFVSSRELEGVFEVPLEPVSGNISQAGYLVLGGLTFIGLCVLLLDRRVLDGVRKGLFLWCGLHAGMGLIDLIGKLVHLGDLLAPIRTANYRLLVDVSQAGFPRIVGAFSEASSFGGVSLTALAFTFTYWYKTNSRPALLLSILLLVLLVLCTSSTAYAGLVILTVPVVAMIGHSIFLNRLTRKELLILVVIAGMLLTTLFVYLVNPAIFDPFLKLIRATVIDKASSASAQERTYWNIQSLKSFYDTAGLGVGLGSSRASSWLIAVISQLGLPGAVIIAFMVWVLLRGAAGRLPTLGEQDQATVLSVRAMAIAGMVTASLVGSTADPGISFFIALAVVSMCPMLAAKDRTYVLPPTWSWLDGGGPASTMVHVRAGSNRAGGGPMRRMQGT